MDAQIPNLEELLQCLNRQLALFRQLMVLVRNERECIVGVKVKELRDFTYSKEALVNEVEREESRRVRWIADFAQAFGLKSGEVTMELIASKIAPERYEAIMSLKNTLSVIIKRVKENNLENRKLIEIALRDAQVMKKNILGLSSEQAQVYGPKGSIGNAPDRSARFLSKEA